MARTSQSEQADGRDQASAGSEAKNASSRAASRSIRS